MGEWRDVVLDDIVDIIPGYAFKSQHFSESGDMPVIKITDISPPFIDIENAMQVDLSSYDKIRLEKYVIKKGDFVIAMTGATIGKIGRLNKDARALLNQRVAKISPKLGIDHDFVYYSIQGNEFQNFIQNNIDSNSAQENISGSSIGRYPIDLPSLTEQRTIASVLSSLDDKIGLLRRQNQTLEAIAKTLFRQWFVEEADEYWNIEKIGNFVKTNISCIDKRYPFQTIKYLDTGNLYAGEIAELQTMALSDAPSRAKRLVTHNDILISTVRPDQKHYGIFKRPPKDLVVSTGFCVVTSVKVDPHFIYLLLTTNEMTEYLHSIAEGSTSTYPSLKPSDIENLEFQLPPKKVLDRFVGYAEKAWEKIDKNYIKIRNIEKARDTLLPKLMNGEVRIKL